MATIQSNASWQLDATVVTLKADQHHLKITSLVPTARHPGEHVQFSGTFSTEELHRLRDVVEQALEVAA